MADTGANRSHNPAKSTARLAYQRATTQRARHIDSWVARLDLSEVRTEDHETIYTVGRALQQRSRKCGQRDWFVAAICNGDRYLLTSVLQSSPAEDVAVTDGDMRQVAESSRLVMMQSLKPLVNDEPPGVILWTVTVLSTRADSAAPAAASDDTPAQPGKKRKFDAL